MSNQGEYPEDNRVGKHEPHDFSLTRRDLIKVTAVVYPHSTLAASVPAATPAPEIMPLTLKVCSGQVILATVLQ